MLKPLDNQEVSACFFVACQRLANGGCTMLANKASGGHYRFVWWRAPASFFKKTIRLDEWKLGKYNKYKFKQNI